MHDVLPSYSHVLCVCVCVWCVWLRVCCLVHDSGYATCQSFSCRRMKMWWRKLFRWWGQSSTWCAPCPNGPLEAFLYSLAVSYHGITHTLNITQHFSSASSYSCALWCVCVCLFIVCGDPLALKWQSFHNRSFSHSFHCGCHRCLVLVYVWVVPTHCLALPASFLLLSHGVEIKFSQPDPTFSFISTKAINTGYKWREYVDWLIMSHTLIQLVSHCLGTAVASRCWCAWSTKYVGADQRYLSVVCSTCTPCPSAPPSTPLPQSQPSPGPHKWLLCCTIWAKEQQQQHSGQPGLAEMPLTGRTA